MSLYLALDIMSDNIEEITNKPDLKPVPYLRFTHIATVLVEVLGYGWHEVGDDGIDWPQDHDPLAYYGGVTDAIWMLQSGSGSDDGSAKWDEAAEMNPWGPYKKEET
ncbi:hypothetical protein BD413DRAFT_494801 [Trametes elegans]|nr:hypothetical protein BD413DRAFT_494801 [Trametes elegans]